MTSFRICYLGLTAVALLGMRAASAQPLPKAAVADKIRKVEDGVDEFRKYLERRGDDARDRASAAQSTGAASRKQSRRGASSTANTEARRSAANEGKDELDDALGDLNRSTNRLRRRFDATDTWMETKVQVDAVLDDARRINQTVARGKYGSEVARLWAALRTQINDLARAYGLAPLGL
jgi:hypothetical protein